MNRTMEYEMAIGLAQAREKNTWIGHVGVATNELDRQRLRILRCTAHAMVSSAGGLRFKAGTRLWLDGLPSGRSDRDGVLNRRKDGFGQSLPIDR